MLMTKTAKPEVTAEGQAESNWQFSGSDQSEPGDSSELPTIEPVNWTALEFIHHDKDAGWYLGLAGFTVVASILIYFLSSHDTVATFIVVIVAAAFGFSASRKPRELTYSIDSSGIHIGSKLYPYDGFKSFSVVDDDADQSVWLMPLKRFMPIIPIYFHQEDERKIVGTLANILPFENHEPGVVDKLMHKVRF